MTMDDCSHPRSWIALLSLPFDVNVNGANNKENAWNLMKIVVVAVVVAGEYDNANKDCLVTIVSWTNTDSGCS